MEISPLKRDHLGDLATLALRALDHDVLPASLLRRRLFEDPDHDERLSLGIWIDGRLAAAAIGVVRQRSDGALGCVRLIATDPAHRRRGLASALLAELESRLVAAGATKLAVGTDVPVWLFAGVDLRYTAALWLFQRRGYTRSGETYNLAVDLVAGQFDTTAQETDLAARGVVFSRVSAADEPDFDSYLTERWNPTWRYEGLKCLEADPPTGFLARREGKIVGFAVYSIARPTWFGPIGTDPEQRGLGIGTVLLKRCFADLQRAGEKTSEIAWIGPMYFYSVTVDARVCRAIINLTKSVT